MFGGHYGAGLAAAGLGRRVPLWVWFVAVQWLDIVWALLVLLGVEKARVVPGFTEGNAMDLYFMPYSHGLPGALVLSLAFGALVAAFFRRHRLRMLLGAAAAAFSHWVLDFLVHVPDLPLHGDADKVGLGLWRNLAIAFPLELAILGLGAWIYARGARFAGGRGRLIFWGFVGLLALVQVYSNFGPPPESTQSIAVTGLISFLLLPVLAALVERFALARSARR